MTTPADNTMLMRALTLGLPAATCLAALLALAGLASAGEAPPAAPMLAPMATADAPLALVGEPAPTDAGVRLKDLCEISGVRDNHLFGVGLVVGLSGTGDKNPATVRMLRQMLATKHLSFDDADLSSKNVAMVTVTADLPAFARAGSRLYTTVSVAGDATSLRGGMLLQTPLTGADERIYAVAQGALSVGGFGAASPGLPVPGIEHRNIETDASLSQGALVEREVPATLLYGDRLRLLLRESDFTTASRVAHCLGDTFGPARVTAVDANMITLGFASAPSESELVDTIAKLQQLRVAPDLKARVVINERTGTIVAGNLVRISAVAVSHGSLSLRVMPVADRRIDPSDPRKVVDTVAWVDPFTRLKRSDPPAGLRPTSTPGTMNIVAGATVDDIANALNALGAKPHDLVAIFEAIARAGALHAELVKM